MSDRFQSTGRRVAGALLLGLAVAVLAGLALASPVARGSAGAAQYEYGPAGKAYGKVKVVICHKGHTIRVGAPAAKAHLRHGDKLGPC